jgi:hypothetical protein
MPCSGRSASRALHRRRHGRDCRPIQPDHGQQCVASRPFVSRLENEHTEIVVTASIVSHTLARVAWRRELRAVFDEPFGPGGWDIAFRQMGGYDLAPGRCVFPEVQKAVAARGDIAS